ncbi:alpha/beta fold hydrolase [Mycolicibacterium thermoresistibile]
MPSPESPSGPLELVRKEIDRNAKRVRNGIKLAVGLNRPKLGLTPKDVVWRKGRSELWHYRGSGRPDGPPLLLVFSLVSRSYILDLMPGNSFIEALLEAGFDVYLLDWGVPDERDADNGLEDYTDDFIPAAIRRVQELSGADEIDILGYCLGGVLTLLHAAHHPDSPLHSLTVIATPVDMQQMGVLTDLFSVSDEDLEAALDDNGNISPQVLKAAFRASAPTAGITQNVDLWEKLWNDDYVLAHQAMAGWAFDHIPFPGRAARQAVNMLLKDNAMMTDRLVVGGDRVSLRDIRAPLLTVRAIRDTLIPEPSAAPLIDLVGSADKDELRLDAGHIGLIVGRAAHTKTIPMIIEFLKKRSEVST